MRINIINKPASIFNQFIAELRDRDIQTDPMRFRRNLERIGEIFAYEESKLLSYKEKDLQTPLGIAKEAVLTNNVVIASILLTGIPIYNGNLNIFDSSENAFVSAH